MTKDKEFVLLASLLELEVGNKIVFSKGKFFLSCVDIHLAAMEVCLKVCHDACLLRRSRKIF